MKRLLILLTVSVSGAAVLALELLGTRLLGPFYGVSIFLWSALISVTLAALALGYAIGGRAADRGADFGTLAGLLGVAGAWTVLIPMVRNTLLHATEPFGLRTAVLLASMVLFFPPLTLLGMVTPIAVRLRTRSLEDVGRSAGEVYAVSTVASVAAALLTGFVLVPQFGVRRLLLLTGCALFVMAAVLAVAAGRRKRAGAVVASVVAVLVALWPRTAENSGEIPGLRRVEQSAYGEIRVLDEEDGYRYLILDGGSHALVRIGTWESRHGYVAAAELMRHFFPPSGGRIVAVGMGAGSLARAFHEAGWRVDVVEIDPAIPRVARAEFGFTPELAEVFVADGRRYLNVTPRHYDIIMLDAFGSSSVPFHLLTREAFTIVRNRLLPGGVVGLNLISTGRQDELVRSVAATLRSVFGHVLALPTGEDPEGLGNVVLLASDRALEFPEERLPNAFGMFLDAHERWRVRTQTLAWENRYVPDAAGAILLTDDRSPVDLWGERVNQELRVGLHSYFARKGVSW